MTPGMATVDVEPLVEQADEDDTVVEAVAVGMAPESGEVSILTENVAKDTFKGSLFDCQENVSHYTYYCLNNQCEY